MILMYRSVDAIEGCLVGMAVGDALGLPRESLSPHRAFRLFGPVEGYSFLFGRGMFSDDTEHALLTAQSLIVSAGNGEAFLRALSWRLRFWLLGFPLSIGRATLKACIKLWLGWSGRSSGVRSAGNGPLTRAPIIGLCYGDDPAKLRELIQLSTRMTHTDPRVEWAALVMAWSTQYAARTTSQPIRVQEWLNELLTLLPAEAKTIRALMLRVSESVAANQTTEAFAEELGLQRGVSGFVMDTLPIVLHAWLRFPDDYLASVQTVIRCGGDADTTAALVGAMVGARLGVPAIPQYWRNRLAEWPRNVHWITRLSRRLASVLETNAPARAVPTSWLGILARNLLFNMTVIAHVWRRLLPPY